MFFRCAQIVAPTGGEVDQTPPQLVINKCTPKNYSTNFSGQEITLQFDEFFTLDNPQKNILITPTLQKLPSFKKSGKKLNISFKEQLKENTTYTINFGESIKDYNAGNKLQNFSYVFSTGNYLDSLSLSGNVNYAESAEPASEFLVLLYDKYYDSVPHKEKPFYFTKTNKVGKFQFNNLKKGNFKIFTLKDENNNYLYDLPIEEIGYLDSLISISEEDSNQSINLQVYLPIQSQKLISKKYLHPGKLELIYRNPVEKFQLLNYSGKNLETYHISYGTNNDTLRFWLKDTNLNEVIATTSAISDTIKLNVKSQKKQLIKLQGVDEKTNEIHLNFSEPIFKFIDSLITIKQDSTEVEIKNIFIDSLNKQLVHLVFKTKPKLGYKIHIKEKAFKGYYNNFSDSAAISFKTKDPQELGNLLFIANGKDSCQYIFLLKTASNEVKYKSTFLGKEEIKIQNLLPGKYNVYVIIDTDFNRIWSPGNYWNKQKPESVIKFNKTLEIRANWDLKETWELPNCK